MSKIPVYLKTDEDMPRPQDEVYYLVAENGAFLCRNHPFFTSDAPLKRRMAGLRPHRPAATTKYPLIPQALLEQAVGVFGRIYDLYKSEAIVLLGWNLRAKRYELLVPEQEVTVCKDGWGASLHVKYTTPTALPPGVIIAGDIHSHADIGAYNSGTDDADEEHRDGIHVIVGKVNKEPPEFHIDLAVDGARFSVKEEDIFEGYKVRNEAVPQEWLDRVKAKEAKPWGKSYSESSWRFGDDYHGSYYGSKKSWRPGNKWYD